MAEIIVGIDLGTTNSEIAYVKDGRPIVIPDETGDPILPSFVGLSEDGKLLVGKAARNQWGLAPERTIKSIKRKMGEDVRVTLGDQAYTPQEISAMILRTLKERAEAHLKQPVRKAVITVPAFFNDTQRQATRTAGALAGLEVVRIINEPTAAALTYDPKHQNRERFLVYDLGGGTFDVSIVHLEAGLVEVLASHGDTHLGGDDFDDLLRTCLAQRFETEHGVDLRSQRVSNARLLRAAEQAKKTLSSHPFAKIEEEFIAEKDGVSLHLNAEIDRQEYENLIRKLIERTMDCVQRALEDAGLTAAAIDQVVLVGGSTRTPIIGEWLERRLGKPAHREVNPELCVAMGAAIQGAIIAGQDVGAVLVDITPHSLGIKAFDPGAGFGGFPFRFAPIIGRRTPLPTSQSELFRTVSDNQSAVDIEVYQGESEDVRRNHLIGKFTITGLAKLPAGNPIVVQCDLTLDGTLKVTAKEKISGLSKHVLIQNALAQFGREEQQKAVTRLNELFAARHPQGWAQVEEAPDEGDEFDEDTFADDEGAGADDTLGGDEGEEPLLPPAIFDSSREEIPELVNAPRGGQREAVQAKALLEKAERIRAKVNQEDQQELDRLTTKLRIALTDRRWNLVTDACNELADILFYLEDA